MISPLLCAISLGAAGAGSQPAAARPDPPLILVKTIPLPGVRGRIDHMAFDAETGRLFVAALGNGSLEIVDVSKGERVLSMGGLDEPQGVLVAGNAKGVSPCLIVACGGDGAAHIFDRAGGVRLKKVDLAPDADNLRRAWFHIYAGCGTGGSSAIARFSIDNAARIGDHVERISLPGHPEAFELLFTPWPAEEPPTAHPDRQETRLLVNIPTLREIAVLDLGKQQVVAHWPLNDVAGNFPMRAWQEERPSSPTTTDRVIVGCRQPPTLLLLDASSGARLASVPCAPDVDDLILSADHTRLWAICGGDGGAIDGFEVSSETLAPRGRLATSPGSRTGVAVSLPGHGEALAVACPSHADQPAAIRIFAPPPRP